MTECSTANKAGAMAWPARGATGWLALAASPTFAVMAWIGADRASPMALCAMGSSGMPLGGMTTMYLLMCLFHLSPWLKLATSRRWARC